MLLAFRNFCGLLLDSPADRFSMQKLIEQLRSFLSMIHLLSIHFPSVTTVGVYED